MPTTFITGAAGFTAKYVAQALKAFGHNIVGMTQTGGTSCEHFDAEIQADLLDPIQLAEALRHVQPDHVVHLAAIAQVDHINIPAMYATNIIGTRHLLHGLDQLLKPPSSILLASSANVYGNVGGIISEAVPPLPANDYGVTKLAMESVAHIFANRLPIIVTRPFNYTGIGQSTAFLIPKIVAAARTRTAQLTLGNLNVSRDFSDVRSVANHYARLLIEPRAIGETVNVCSDKSTSLRELIELIEGCSGHQFEIVSDPKLARKGEVLALQGNSMKLSDLIGSLKSIALSDTINWMLTGRPEA